MRYRASRFFDAPAQVGKAPGRAAEDGAEGEQGKGPQVEPLSANQGAAPAGHGHHDDLGDAIAGGPPGDE